MAIPTFYDLMLPVLKLAQIGPIRQKDAVEQISDDMNLSPEDRESMLPSKRQTRMSNRVGWAITHLCRANLVERPERGYFTITDRGTEALASNPVRINRKYLLQFSEYKWGREDEKPSRSNHQSADEGMESATPDERIISAYDELFDDLKDEVLRYVLEAPPAFFEHLVLDLLQAMGYGVSSDSGSHVGGSGDGGIDGIINEDKLGLDVIYIQAKRYDRGTPVGRPAIQAFVGALAGKGASKGVFFTTSKFTNEALDYVKTVQQRLVLVDGERLAQLMIENNVGVRLGRAIELKRIDEDFFADE